MVWNVIDAKLSYLRTLILKPRAFTRNVLINNWLKPKLRNFTSKKPPRTKWLFAPRRCATTNYELCIDPSHGHCSSDKDSIPLIYSPREWMQQKTIYWVQRCAVYKQLLWGNAEEASMYEYADRQPENIQHDGEWLRYQSVATDLCI